MRSSVLIVEDESPARAKLARLIRADGRFAIVGEATNGIEAVELVRDLDPGLVVIDIGLPGLDGLEVLDAIGPQREFAVIFSTAHEEYALRAFDVHAVDYLLKPYDAERLRTALDKAYARLVASNATLATPPGRLVWKTESGFVRISSEDVLHVTVVDKICVVTTRAETHTVRESLAAVARKLGPRFVRVHRAELVNLDAVVRLEPGEHGDGVVILRNGRSVPLSRTYRRGFLERFCDE